MDDLAPEANARAWLSKGDEDLEVVDILVRVAGPSGQACFHCQQAVEKYLKACLVACGDVPPKTHDVEYLLDLIDGHGVSLSLDRDALASLRPYAVAPRYPGFGDAHAERDLPGLHALTRSVRAAVQHAAGARRAHSPRGRLFAAAVLSRVAAALDRPVAGG